MSDKPEEITKATASATEGSPQEPEKPNNYVFTPRLRVVGTFQHGSVHLRELEGVEKCAGAPLLEGFPSVGITSIIVSSYVVEQMKLPLIGVMTSEDEFKAMGVIRDHVPSHAVRLYGDERMVVIVSEISLGKNSQVIRDVVRCIFDFAIRHRCPNIFTVDGLPLETLDTVEQLKIAKNHSESMTPRTTGKAKKTESEKKEDNENQRQNIRFLTTSEELGKILKEKGHTPITDAVITGITGWVLAEAPFIPVDGPNVTCLLAPVSAMFPDAWGAVNVVGQIRDLLPTVEVDLSPLTEKAGSLESKISKHLDAAKKTLHEQQPHLQSAPSGMYS